MTILYIDDDPDDLEVFCEAVKIANSHAHCFTTSSAQAGLQLIGKHNPDVIFIDYRMPGMDGETLVREMLNAVLPNEARIYLYSTFMNEFEIARCRKLGATDCLQKVGDFNELCQMLARILN